MSHGAQQPSAIDFNCDCEVISAYATLAELRERMMIRLGYSAQRANPPPGMSAEIDDFLRSAQRLLYVKNPSLRTERFYRWTMIPGIRYYGIPDNDTQTEFTDILASCNKDPDVYGITWVGFEDLNGAWQPLTCGINPALYTDSVNTTGWPSHYEVRGCIEIWPAPSDSYKLWVKGRFGIEPFTANGDRATIDDELVFLLALGNAKAHRGQRDAQGVLAQAGQYLLDVKAGRHLTRRYIPGLPSGLPLAQPRFLPLE